MTKGTMTTIPLHLAGALAVVGAFAGLLAGGCTIDREITKPPETRDLRREEICAKLQSPDFKHKLEAEKQIDKLEPVEKRRILLALSSDSDPAVRLITVKHLARIDDSEARERLTEIATSDPDATVREIAGGSTATDHGSYRTHP